MGMRSEPPPWEEDTHARHRTLHTRICDVESRVVDVEETIHTATGGFRMLTWVIGLVGGFLVLLASWLVLSTAEHDSSIRALSDRATEHKVTGHHSTQEDVGELRVQSGRVESQLGEVNRRLGQIEHAITARPEPDDDRPSRPRR